MFVCLCPLLRTRCFMSTMHLISPANLYMAVMFTLQITSKRGC